MATKTPKRTTKKTTKRPTSKRTPASKSKKRAAHVGSRPQDLLKEVRNADRPLTFRITEDHVAIAECRNPEKCVIAQALYDSAIGQIAEEFQVGSTCTKIVTGQVIIRYTTPNKLRLALRTFDKTELWHLPPGEYTLNPYKGAQNRWNSAKRKGGKQSIFYGRISAPTRHAKSIQSLRKAA